MLPARLVKNAKANFHHASVFDLLYLVFLGTATLFYFAVGFEHTTRITQGSVWVIIYASILMIIFVLWLAFLGTYETSKHGLWSARIALAPLLFVVLLTPFNYYYPVKGGTLPLYSLVIIFGGILIIGRILRKGVDGQSHKRVLNVPLIITLTFYATVFSILAALRHFNFHGTSSFDSALYNQIQWNNLHGNFYQSSISGSNFVTHNSPFLILLTPFYAIYPHPLTLMVIKSVFLAVSAIPLFLILRKTVHPGAVYPIILGYLFYPYIVGQNFNAPHEMCYLPPFLLFSYYFFISDKFKSFLVFLLISLSVKEHMAMIAFMYGIYAMWLKKEMKWIVVPMAIGVVWAAFSIWIIYFFQNIYDYDPSPAWLIENIKNRFFRPEGGIGGGLLWGLKTSVLGNVNKAIFIYSIFSSVGLVLPFLSFVWLIGSPELWINLVTNIPLFFVEWHYNIAVGCFVILGSIAAIVKLAKSISRRNPGLSPGLAETVLSWFMCICVLSHFFLWWNLTSVPKNAEYVEVMNSALRKIPNDASVSVPKHLAVYVSSRRDYFLLSDKRRGDYFLIDRNGSIDNYFPDKTEAAKYDRIFRKGRISVFKKTIGKGKDDGLNAY